MKLMIASDLHGSYEYGKMLIERFKEENCSSLALLGDLYYHGPRNPIPAGYSPMELAELLNGMKNSLIVVKGNCDSDIDETISDFPFYPFYTLETDGVRITMEHGHLHDINDMPKNAGNIFLYGHYHKGFITEKDGVIVANPGSVTLPKDGTQRSYLIFDGEKLSLKELETGKELLTYRLNPINIKSES